MIFSLPLSPSGLTSAFGGIGSVSGMAGPGSVRSEGGRIPLYSKGENGGSGVGSDPGGISGEGDISGMGGISSGRGGGPCIGRISGVDCISDRPGGDLCQGKISGVGGGFGKVFLGWLFL